VLFLITFAVNFIGRGIAVRAGRPQT